MAWIDKIDNIVVRYDELSKKLSGGNLTADEIRDYSKEYSDLNPIVSKIKEYKKLKNDFVESQEMMKDADAEIAEMAKEEFNEIKENLPKIEKDLSILMLPKDEADSRNAIMEIRAGTGGDEANIFAGDLFRMYQRYCDLKSWKYEILEASPNEVGGYSFVSMQIIGKDVFSRLKYESGGHRVQRVPETESNGRVHTSAATVAVLPEAREVDVKIDPSDLRIDTFRASGAGGQHVNTTDSAVRITHEPTGVVAACQAGRSQHKNKDQAMKMLLSMLYEKQREEQAKERSDLRQGMVGSGDRSQRIRTYNFPQGRLTEHRIGFTIYKLDKVMMGEIDEIIDAMITEMQLRQLSAIAE